ncbi:MAG TPA: sulfotransferase [Acidimicrobiales bacterium]|nr:sulfotransferase [Acidimicrobiales bacterium]
MTFDPDGLMAQAVAVTGDDDFGEPEFSAGLRVYCASLTEEAKLSALGTAAIGGTIVASLANRLRVVDWARQHGGVRNEPIDAPIVVIGMFRAGTTLLSYLLDQDPANRALLGWEAADSVPPPTPETHRRGPRLDAAREKAALLDQLNPAARVVHHEEPDGPTEDIAVMAQDFKSLSWEAISNVPSYSEWLMAVDQTSAYRYHHLVLQTLQSCGVRGRWALKSPHHAIALDALVSVYPDARLVLLHRDPTVLCASVCSLIRTLSSTFTDEDHVAYIARHWTALLEESIARIERFRAARPDKVICDVLYADLVRDPAAAVGGIYRALGLDVPPGTLELVAAYADRHPRGEFGTHRYDLAEFGLDAGSLRERFADYTHRYGVPEERAVP